MFAHHLACENPKPATLLRPAVVLHVAKRDVSALLFLF